MGISVIIPVYNAEAYVREAVESVLRIDEVRQIILVEDGSPDNCLAICQDLERLHPNIIELHNHPGREQKGAGASRNLGIEKVREQFVAFLDADDYYLPQRFTYPLEILSKRPEIDYVVSPSRLEYNSEQYTMMSEEANNASGNLFPALLTERYGYFDTNSIIIRSHSLKRLSKFFDPHLQLHQDSELWLRIAYKLRGYAENITLPGSIVRRHSKNRVTHTNADSLAKYWDVVATEFERFVLPGQLTRFIRLRRNHYRYLKKKSILSYWFLIYMRFYDSIILSRVQRWNALLESRYLLHNIEPAFDEHDQIVRSSC